MSLLIAGVVLWSMTHLIPAVAPGVRSRLVERFGEGPFKGFFSVDILLALALIVLGWKSSTPAAVYTPPLIGSPVPAAFVGIAVLCLVASSTPNNLKRYIRHPQMTAVILWGIGHLLANGDSRSIVLFGGLSLWAVMEIVFINRRDGKWQKPAAVSPLKDLAAIFLAVIVSAALVHYHAALFGVAALV